MLKHMRLRRLEGRDDVGHPARADRDGYRSTIEACEWRRRCALLNPSYRLDLWISPAGGLGFRP
jgi:hypothetical protein